jgi:hypothetical protein
MSFVSLGSPATIETYHCVAVGKSSEGGLTRLAEEPPNLRQVYPPVSNYHPRWNTRRLRRAARRSTGNSCAAAIRQAVRTLGLEIRALLHTGECQLV